MSLKWKEIANHLTSANSPSRTRTALYDPTPQLRAGLYGGWCDQVRPHPQLRSLLSPDFLHSPFYLGALPGRSLKGAEPDSAWCGQCSESAEPPGPSACRRCLQMPSSGAGSLISSRFPCAPKGQEPAKTKPACKRSKQGTGSKLLPTARQPRALGFLTSKYALICPHSLKLPSPTHASKEVNFSSLLWAKSGDWRRW